MNTYVKLWPVAKSPESQVEVVTVCETGSVLTQETVEPTGTLRVDGLKANPTIVMLNVPGGFVTTICSESD